MIFACPGSGAGDSNNYMFPDGSITQTNVWGDSVHNSGYSQSSNDGLGYGSTNNGYGDSGGASNANGISTGNGDGSGDGMTRFP